MTTIASHPHQAARWIERVVLAARDPDRLAAFYADLFGLDLARAGDDTALRTPGGRDLFRVRPATAPIAADRVPGLFHTAILLPRRGDLGSWLAAALRSGVRLLGASDHGVSEALYLADPEGNGIEVYADRPVTRWHDARGALRMPTEPLDLDDLARAETGAYGRAPSGTIIGHVHLSVPDLAPVQAWAAQAGLSATMHVAGATFLSWDGYHHHLAANTWGTRDASAKRPEGAPGLAKVVIGGTASSMRVSDLMGMQIAFEPTATANARTTAMPRPVAG